MTTLLYLLLLKHKLQTTITIKNYCEQALDLNN